MTAFIEHPEKLNVKLQGKLDKILAIEWAKFRWGVFDDSPAPNSGRDFYATQSFVEASKCSLEVEGRAILREDSGMLKKGDSCTAKQKLTPGVCHFVPSQTQSSSNLGSILYNSHVEEITEYCDNDNTNRNTLHNREAPTRQNLLWYISLEDIKKLLQYLLQYLVTKFLQYLSQYFVTIFNTIWLQKRFGYKIFTTFVTIFCNNIL